jgi:predicted Fe-Mo cluster-binding NifX family protein
MKILISTSSPDIDSQVDPRFGRSAFFLLVDPDTFEWQSLPNPALSAPGGAGIQAAQFAVSQGCHAVISGHFGPNAAEALQVAGISTYLFGSSQTVHQVIDRYNTGQLELAGAPTPASHKK